MSQQPQVPRGAGLQDAHPPQPDEDPVGLCPGSLLIGSQEVLHHGDPPARQGHRSAHRVWEQGIEQDTQQDLWSWGRAKPLVQGCQKAPKSTSPPCCNSWTLSGARQPSCSLTQPCHHPSPAPAPQEQAGQHLLLFWDPLYSTQRVGVADVAGQRLHQGVPDV